MLHTIYDRAIPINSKYNGLIHIMFLQGIYAISIHSEILSDQFIYYIRFLVGEKYTYTKLLLIFCIIALNLQQTFNKHLTNFLPNLV